MSTENLEHEDQNRTTEPIIDILGNEAPSDPEQEIVSQGVHNYSAAETYVCPTDPAVLQQLEWFRDQKLALMMHFWIVLPARHGCLLGIKRQGFRLVPPPGKLDGRRNL